MSSASNGKIMFIRNFLSFITGLALFFIPIYILWVAFGYGAKDIPPDCFYALSIAMEILLGFAAGYVTALLAKKYVLWTVCTLAGLIALQNLGYILLGPEGSPVWPYALSLLMVTPAVIIGGVRVNKKSQKES